MRTADEGERAVASAVKHYDEALVTYYEDQLLVHSDALYRFAVGLTLSPELARQCVLKTYRNVAKDLENVKGTAGDAQALVALIAECGKCYGELRGKASGETTVPVLAALKALAEPLRAALVAVDVVGLSPEEAARALGASEADLRSRLAQARKGLVASKGEF